MPPKPQHGTTLGQYLQQAKEECGYSLRQLAAKTGIHESSINRLLKDQVDEPVPDNLIRLAEALELNASDLFLLADLPIPTDVPSLETLLRTEYDLPEEAIEEATQNIQSIVKRYGARRQKEI